MGHPRPLLGQGGLCRHSRRHRCLPDRLRQESASARRLGAICRPDDGGVRLHRGRRTCRAKVAWWGRAGRRRPGDRRPESRRLPDSAEVAWNDSEANMLLQEELVSYLVQRVLERRRAELSELERDVTKLESVKAPFDRLNYTDAIALVQARGSTTQWGEDLGAEDEALIVRDATRPVFVFNYPKTAKAFYMKENPDDPRTVLCDDLLAPEGFGEMIGGSQREDDYDKLVARIKEEGLPMDAYGWDLDLRKYGTFPHAGLGLCLERTVAWSCGVRHIREVIAFPRMMNRLRPGSVRLLHF